MPGARLKTFREGDLAEAFAAALLKRIAYVTPVPREEDVGHDFFCAIAESEGSLIKAGPTFTIQVKSNNSPISYRKKHEVEWIMSQENPLLIAVSRFKKDSLQLFSTWNMLNAFLLKSTDHIRLIPKEPANNKDCIQWIGSPERLDVYLGRPILEISSKCFNNKKEILSFTRILRDWILLDRENIVRKASKMYWVIGPIEYQTNSTFRGRSLKIKFFYNEKNLHDCKDNFVRSSIALALVLRKFPKPPSGWEKLGDDIVGFLQHYRGIFNPAERQRIKEILGIEM